MKIIRGSLAIFSMLLILIVCMGMASASDDSILSDNESSTVLQSDEIQVEGGDFEDIQVAIDDVESGGYVNLTEPFYVSGSPSEYRSILILKPVTISGLETQSTLNAQYNSNLIDIKNADNVVIKNIKFTKINGGSAVYINNANVTFINCNFESNSGYQGAAINIYSESNEDVTTNIINCTFDGNTAYSVGGAMYISQNEASFTTNILQSTFRNNAAIRGGAVYIGSSNDKRGYLGVYESNFEYNMITPQEESFEWAGADISLMEDLHNFEVDIANSNFINMQIMGEMDAIPSRSLVLNNDIVGFDNNTFKNSTVFFNKTRAEISGCSFEESNIQLYRNFNYEEDIPASDDLTLNIKNSNFTGSHVELGQGKISDSYFIDSTIDKDSAKDLTITGSRFSNRSSITLTSKVDILNSEFDEAYVIAYDYAVLRVENSTFENNIAVEGAAIRLMQPQAKDVYSNLTVKNSRFINNTARYWGGAISTGKSTEINIHDSIFLNNSARNGGAIFTDSSKGNISNCIFEGNVARNLDNETYDYLKKNYRSTGVPIEYVFKTYLDEYDKDLAKWDNYYKFPEYIYGYEIISGVDPIRYAYYGSAVFGKNVCIENNFWGLNIKDNLDLYVNRLISAQGNMMPSIWVNYVDGAYVTSDNKSVEMPDYTPVNAERKEVIVTVAQQGDQFRKTNITVNVIDAITKEPIANQEVHIVFSNNIYAPIYTDENGTAVYRALEDVGSYHVSTIVAVPGYRAVEVISNATIVPQQLTVIASKLTTTYNSGKKLTITILNSDNSTPDVAVSLKVKVYTGNTPKTYYVMSNAKGKAYFAPGTKVAVGTHKVEIISFDSDFKFSKATTSIKITKAKTTIKAPKVTARYKKSKYFKVTVKNSATKKVVTNTKVKIKVYTGKKYKTFTVKTNSKGIAQINTKSLAYGKHKVVISSGNSNYIMSAKSTITIKW